MTLCRTRIRRSGQSDPEPASAARERRQHLDEGRLRERRIVVPDDHGITQERAAVEDAGQPHDLVPSGVEAHSMLRLDGRFFNIHEEGAKVRDPLPLGLQWMVDLEGDEFRGQGPLLERREAGYAKKIIGVIPGDETGALEAGDAIVHQGEQVAEVITACDSPTLGRRVGLALFELPFAYSGLALEGGDGRSIQTISMPPFTPKSLTVKLDEM